MEEFTKAAESVAELLPTAEVDWSRLFEPYPFFSLFKNFLQVTCGPGSRCISHDEAVSALCVLGAGNAQVDCEGCWAVACPAVSFGASSLLYSRPSLGCIAALVRRWRCQLTTRLTSGHGQAMRTPR
jgi:hypothetical protein